MVFNCYIIGEGTLPIQCGEILLERGNRISGVISTDASLIRWAQEKAIPAVSPERGILEFLGKQPFDYLFSIVNNHILPKEVFALPRQYAINYHDGPLPRYAGTHATSWALMNREPSHGITWHVVSDMVDGGDILKQRVVDIAADETAFTLNAKCYEAAIDSFSQLIDELAAGGVHATKQNLEDRTFFPRFKRPLRAGVLSWNDEATVIDALVRSLDFGPYPNPMGLPKLLLGTEYVLVRDLDITNDKSSAPAGTITNIGNSGVKVATTTVDVILRKLQTIDGKDLSVSKFVAGYGLQERQRFDELDRALAERISNRNESLAKQEWFWVDRLATSEPISFPYIVADLGGRDDDKHYASILVPIPEATASVLNDRLSTWRPSDCLIACFAIYVSRLGGMGGFDIGFADEELRTEMAGLDGLYASSVPMRIGVESAWSFDDVLEAVGKELELMRRHHTFARDVTMRYPVLCSKSRSVGGHEMSVMVARSAKIKNYVPVPGSHLTLVVSDECEEIGWFFDADVLQQKDIERVTEQFDTLLKGIVDNPDAPVSNVPLLSEPERRKLLVDFNNTEVSYSQERCVHELIADQVAKAPNAIAVTYQNQSLTYNELNWRANQVAHHLRDLGVGCGSLVGICVDRSLEMVVGLLGILKAGGTYVPLDPAFPQDRLAFMAADAELSLVITKESLKGVVPETQSPMVRLDADWETIGRRSRDNLGSIAGPEDIAYVLYTSGSTGKPKGVEIPHRALTNFLCSMRAEPGCSERDVLLAVTTLSFDIAGLELYLPLISGGHIVLASREGAVDGQLLQQLIDSSGATLLQATPATWRMLLESGWPGTNRLTALCGGEGLPKELARRLLERVAVLWNMYGPTETTVWSSVQRLRSDDAEITIGRPIANTTFYILDGNLQPVPVGVPGELFIGGDGLARGYRNRPELTAEKFISDPFSKRSGARLYRTGDLARYRDDGQVVHLGRLDHQVKIRGFRIELGEIEAVLDRYPAVQKSVVVARSRGASAEDAYLAAYVVAEPGAEPTLGELRRELGAALPDYMVPSAFMIMDELPLTPNGKVDRRALPEPNQLRPGLENTPVAARTPTEQTLVEIWKEILKVEQVGTHDDFFELGGHSLLATRMIGRIERDCGVTLPMRSLLDTPTVAGLAETIVRQQAETVDDAFLEGLLAELEQLPEDEALKQLAAGDQE